MPIKDREIASPQQLDSLLNEIRERVTPQLNSGKRVRIV
jgi:hypothetical protein